MEAPSKQEVGKRLRKLRGNKKVKDLAKVCGITRQMYWYYETGHRTPSDKVKVKLANYYGTTVDAIFFTK